MWIVLLLIHWLCKNKCHRNHEPVERCQNDLKDDLEGKRFYHISTDEVYGSLGAEGLQKRQHMILILLILHPKRAQITLLGLW
jgi:hypothetical protein